ncbi:MAG: MDR family MFS transporter [Blastocatellia bacterium]
MIPLTTISLRKVRVGVTLFGVAMAIFMSALEATVVGTAMPTVVASLGGIEIYSWVFAAYILASTVMTPVWGKLADMVGRRAALFGGLAAFIAGSALSGMAQTMPQLIGFRVIQGLGAAALFPIGMTIVAEILTMEQRAKMIGLFSGMWGIASLIGPTAGGYLTEYTPWSWRACFYVILPFGALSILLVGISYKEEHEGPRGGRFDYGGMLTLSACLVAMLLLIERNAQFGAWTILFLAIAAIVFFLLFLHIERTHPAPLIPLGLFSNRIVATAVLHGMFAMMALIGTMSFLPLFVQAVMGTDAVEAGKILISIVIPWVGASIVGGRLLLRFGYRPVVAAGMVAMGIGAAFLALVSDRTSMLHLSTAATFLGIGGGLTIVTLMIAAQHGVPRAQLGVATSTVQFARNIGAAIGASAMGALMSWRLNRLLTAAPAGLANLVSHQEIASLIRPETRATLSTAAAGFLRHALATSLQTAFLFVLGVTIITAGIAFFIPAGKAQDLAYKNPPRPSE